MTLTEFLLARIAEDEAAIRAGDDELSAGVKGYFWGGNDWGSWLGVTRARALAECEAKRRIVEGRMIRESDQVQRLLALPYADHPDYDPEWRP